jgi:cytochrome c peroxidase
MSAGGAAEVTPTPHAWRVGQWVLLACLTSAQALVGPVGSCESTPPEPVALTIDVLDGMTRLPGELGPLPPVPVSAENPQDEAKVELGRKLFFDARLSRDRIQSCASCHDPEKGFSDGRPRALGFEGRELARRSPSVLNAAYNHHQFWDGRASSLEQQAEGPLLAAAEMNMSADLLSARLGAIPEYNRLFQGIFEGSPTLKNVAKAIAAFERTLITPNAPFDAYARGNKNALTLNEKRGLILFIGKAACVQCHNGPTFTDSRFHRLGVHRRTLGPEDVGRFAVSGHDQDRGAFKTPTLRNVSLGAPYMHDGALKTLEEVVDFYDRGGDLDPQKSPLIFELGLSKQEKSDLIAFLRSLTGQGPVGSIPGRRVPMTAAVAPVPPGTRTLGLR